MSEPTYRPVTGADRDALARFLSEHHWPFHVRARPGPAEAARLVAGWDLDAGSRAWWLEREGQVAGLLRVEDLDAWGRPEPGPAHRRGPQGGRARHRRRPLAIRRGLRRLAGGQPHRGPDPA